MNILTLVSAICKILLDKDYSFSVDFVPVALEQLWVKRCVSTHKSYFQSVFSVSCLALRQSPAAGYKTQSVVVLAVGFGPHTSSSLLNWG